MKKFRAGMWLILGAVVVLGLSVAPSHAAFYNGNEYQVFLAEGISWTNAGSTAGAAGWQLATITSSGEEAFIESLLTLTGSRDEYWLGGARNPSTNIWSWVNGDTWSYTKWGEGQPDNWSGDPSYPQNYLAMDSDQLSWGWDDNSGTNYVIRGYIGERVASVPEPSALLLLGSGLIGMVGYRRRKRMM